MVEAGKKYGKLTTLRVVGRTKYRQKIWECVCDCGNHIEASSASLTTGNTRSCGCLRRETARKNGEKVRKLNAYDLTGEYGIGYTSNNKEFYFDLEDYDKICNFTWTINPDGYVISSPFGKLIRMHMLVTGSDGSKVVDHINHITYDNRKTNLRICEKYQNVTYSKKYSNNTSGRKGVYWDKSRGKWMATLTFNKKVYNLGRFENFDEAVIAREQAEMQIHKEFHYEG